MRSSPIAVLLSEIRHFKITQQLVEEALQWARHESPSLEEAFGLVNSDSWSTSSTVGYCDEEDFGEYGNCWD
jgi:hypothetical protein